MEPQTRSPVRFGVFEVDLAAHELRKYGVRVKLQQQPFQVLRMLLERPGAVVKREELQQALWSDDTFVEFDKNLSTAVQKIRQALGDSSSTPRFVETVPRVGYRFIAPLAAAEASPAAAPKARGERLWWSLSALAFVALGLAFLIWQPSRPTAPVVYEPIPLTRYPGIETEPSFSPDGSQIAFAWDGGEEGRELDIYVKTIGPGDPVRLTEHPYEDSYPAWSPDGRSIAFKRKNPTGELDDVLVIPALGGRERLITKVGTRVPIGWNVGRGVAWTADSQWLIVTEPTLKAGQSVRLYLGSVKTGSGAG